MMNAILIIRRLARGVVPAVFALAIAGYPLPAFAYRPFDGTDAAVAEPGEVEIELQPAGGIRQRTDQGSEKTLIAPAAVFNFGLSEGWEAVFQGQGQTPLSPAGPTSLTGAGAFLKHVLRPGTLQDKDGPSIATEFGVLLPDSTGENGFGSSVAGIISQRWDWGTVHFNTAAAITREHHADLFAGAIVEGPAKWKVRPVAEIFYEEEFGQAHTVSGLVGAIWQVRDNLAVDIGLRHALVNGRPVEEIRGGVTFGFPLSFGGAKASQTAQK
jgi:hypothetical protein